VHFRQLLGTELPQLATTLLYVAAAGGLTLLIGSLSGPPTRATDAVSRVVRFAATALFAIPGVVLALAYARSQDLFEAQITGWSGLGWLALVCVVALKQLPFAQRLLAAQLRTLHQGRLASAHNLGAAPFAAYLRLGLPALGPVLGAIFLLGVVAAAMELSAALLLIKEPQAPLALSLFQALQAPATAGAGAAQAVLLVAVVATGLLLVHALLRRRCHALPKAPAHPTRARKDP